MIQKFWLILAEWVNYLIYIYHKKGEKIIELIEKVTFNKPNKQTKTIAHFRGLEQYFLKE